MRRIGAYLFPAARPPAVFVLDEKVAGANLGWPVEILCARKSFDLLRGEVCRRIPDGLLGVCVVVVHYAARG